MLVCPCNGLTTDEVAGAARAGCTTVREVLAACGCLRHCGKCDRDVMAALREARRGQGGEGRQG